MALALHEQCPVSTQNFVSLECGIYATMYAKCKCREAFNQNLCVFCENQFKKTLLVLLGRLLQMFLRNLSLTYLLTQ